MNIVFRVLGGLLLVLLLGWGILSSAGDSVGVFVNIPSALFLLGILVGGMLLSFEPGQIGRAIAAVFLRGGEGDAERLGRHLLVFERANALSWAGGFVAMLVGIVIMLKNLDDPERIGPGMAVACLPLLYAVFLAEIILSSMRCALLARSTAAPVTPGRPRGLSRSVQTLVVASLLLLLASFLIMVFTEMKFE